MTVNEWFISTVTIIDWAHFYRMTEVSCPNLPSYEFCGAHRVTAVAKGDFGKVSGGRHQKCPYFFWGGGKFISNVQPQAHTVCVLRLFSRLWCIFELAAFRKANPNGRIVLAPLILGGSRFCRSCILYNDRGSGNGSSMVVVDGSSKFLSYPRDGA